jgi:hypothetical protein
MFEKPKEPNGPQKFSDEVKLTVNTPEGSTEETLTKCERCGKLHRKGELCVDRRFDEEYLNRPPGREVDDYPICPSVYIWKNRPAKKKRLEDSWDRQQALKTNELFPGYLRFWEKDVEKAKVSFQGEGHIANIVDSTRQDNDSYLEDIKEGKFNGSFTEYLDKHWKEDSIFGLSLKEAITDIPHGLIESLYESAYPKTTDKPELEKQRREEMNQIMSFKLKTVIHTLSAIENTEYIIDKILELYDDEYDIRPDNK